MTTVLTEVDKVVQKQVEEGVKEIKTDLSSMPKKTTKKEKSEAFGFKGEVKDVMIDNPEYLKKKHKKGKLERISDRRSEIIEELEKKGLNYIAILPEGVWHQLCKNFGLYRFQHVHENGEVTVRKKDMANYLGDTASRRYVLLTFVFLLVAVPNLTLYDLSINLMLGLFFISVLSWPIFKLVHYIYRERFASTESKAKTLWPNHLSHANDSIIANSSIKISFNLDEAEGEKFINILNKLRLHENEIVAEPDAFISKEPVKDADPIVCFNYEGLVAIIHQFGNFPREKEVVEWVKKYGKSILLN